MKPITPVVLIVVATLLIAASAFASTPPDRAASPFSFDRLKLIEENLIACLGSDIPGVRATAALTLKQLTDLAPDYSFDRSIIPLMRIVKDEACDGPSRIAAALALHALRSDRGDYAIKMNARFTRSQRIKHMYEHLALARSLERQAVR
ncbi:MAG: hypothetical protein FJ215_04405 [Ignavibacteria bacterium]|nr:hypothetical protein [Ignavibacteria bacterium]